MKKITTYFLLSIIFVISSSGQLEVSVNNNVAGKLGESLILGGYSLPSITKLTVSGEVNASDIEIMTNNMTSLKEVNILNCSILACTIIRQDAEGSTEYKYDANVFPRDVFTGNTSIKKITLPSTITRIDRYAFRGSGIEGKVVLPESLSSIDIFAFDECTGITEVFFPSTLEIIGDHAFRNCVNLSVTPTFPSSLKSIGSSSFENCSGISGTLIFPEGIETIGGHAFSGCSKLSGTPIFPESLNSIGNDTFAGCTNMEGRLLFPSGIVSIENRTFENCRKITEVVIPSNITQLGYESFKNCTNISLIKSLQIAPINIANNVFEGVDKSNCLLYVPNGSKMDYMLAAVWGAFANIIESDINETYTINITYNEGGHIISNSTILSNGDSHSVYSDLTHSYEISPNDGYEISSIRFNNLDVKNELLNNVFNTPSINSNGLLEVTFTGTPVNIGNNKKVDTVRIYSGGNSEIVIDALKIGDLVSVYTLEGKKIYSKRTKNNRIRIYVPSNSIYIVKTNNCVEKVWVK